MIQELPPIYEKVLSAELLGYVTAVVGTTKLIRNALGEIKGKWAVVISIVAGTAVGEVQLSILGNESHLVGVGAGLLGGIAVAGVFKVTKLLGKKVNLKTAN